MADDPNANSTLDQSEIDKLLAQETAVVPPKQFLIRPQSHKADTPAVPVKVEAYDFRNPAFLSEVELRRLRLLHEDFIRYLSARLSLYLRMEFGLKMARLTTSTFEKFTDSLPNPTHLCLFKVEPLIGVGIFDVNPRLALTIADRLLGGRGHSVKAERYLTEIEIALLEDVIAIVLEEWCAQWKSEQELHPMVIGHENNGRFLQTSPKDAIILILTLEVNFGDCSEQIQLGVPYYTIEPVVKKMQARRQKDTAVTTAVRKAEWQAAYEHISMPVRAEWSALEVGLREITALRVGDVLELPASIFHETRVLLNGVPKFIGTIGLDSDRVAVQLTKKFRTPRLLRPNTMEEKTLDLVLDVKVKITVQLGSIQLPMRDVLELAPGSVVQLTQHASDPVGLFVNDQLVAYGEVVVVEDNFGIKITELVGAVKVP